MPVIRTYACDECGIEFDAMLASSADPDPDCPQCAAVMDWRPGRFGIKTNASRAVDYTQAVLEQDYGVTNINDRQREGDVAAIPQPETRQQRDDKSQVEAIVRAELDKRPDQSNPALAQAAKSFWGGGSGNPGQINAATVLAGAKSGPAGVNPMRHLHRGIESGQIPDFKRNIGRHIIAKDASSS